MNNVPTMDKETALNILKSRTLIKAGVTKNVSVTNVSFENGQTGKPFVWESGSSKGERYAIANFNAVNEYGQAEAIARFKAEDYQGAVNTNLSARVSLENGRKLQEAMYATLDARLTDVERKQRDEDGNVVMDENGEPLLELDSNGDPIIDQAVLIAKCVANEAVDASETKASFDELIAVAEEEHTGMPS